MRMLIRFGKERRLRFISHLDLQRFFQRALNRTELPIAFTQGFNPHPVMSFASALAVGWTSEYEVADVKLSVPIGRKKAEEAMRAALPADMPVLAVRMVDDRHPALMAQVRAADYEIRLASEDSAGFILEALRGALDAFLSEETHMAIRKTKSGEKEINIRPLALDVHWEGDILRARLMLTEKDTLKPDLLLRTLVDMAGLESVEMEIRRLSLLGASPDGTYVELMSL